jgi:hypothetical protein
MSSGYSVLNIDPDTRFKAWTPGAPKIGFDTGYQVGGTDLQHRYEAARTHTEYPGGDLQSGPEAGNDGGGEGWPMYFGGFGDPNENDSKSIGYWFRWINFVPISLSISGSTNASWSSTKWTANIGGGASDGTNGKSYSWTRQTDQVNGGSSSGNSYVDNASSASTNFNIDDTTGDSGYANYSVWRLTATDTATGETAYQDVTIYWAT